LPNDFAKPNGPARSNDFSRGERPRPRNKDIEHPQIPVAPAVAPRKDYATPLAAPREDFAPRNAGRGGFSRTEYSRNERPRSRPEEPQQPVDDDYNEPQKAVGGIDAVQELLAKRPGLVHRVLFRKDSGDKRLYELQKKVKHLHIHHQQLEVAQLDELARPNQGVVALCHEREVATWESVRTDLFAALASQTPKTVAVIVNIEDPRNLGACLRSSLALGVDTVLLPSKGMCGLTPLAARASAGAISQLTLCRPDNLEGALSELVAAGYDLMGLDADTPFSLHDTPMKPHVVIAVGGEDRDLPPFIRKQCTKVLRIPMALAAHSYNASVALSIALYERARGAGFPDMLAPPAPPENVE